MTLITCRTLSKGMELNNHAHTDMPHMLSANLSGQPNNSAAQNQPGRLLNREQSPMPVQPSTEMANGNTQRTPISRLADSSSSTTTPGDTSSTGGSTEREATPPIVQRSGQVSHPMQPGKQSRAPTVSQDRLYSDVLIDNEGPWLNFKSKATAKRIERTSRLRRQTAGQSDAKATKHGPTESRLRGLRPQASAFLYLENVAKGVDDSDATAINNVKSYAQKGQLRVMSVKVIHNRFCEDVVGCRISVPQTQTAHVLDQDFWPEDIFCRPWFKKRHDKVDSYQSQEREGYDYSY